MHKDVDFNHFHSVYVVCDRTDIRYGIDSLAAIIEKRFKVDLFVPNTLFHFCGTSASKIKGLLWEGDGFLLLYKHVEQGHFSWPRNSDELRKLRPEQFKWLMQGFALDSVIHDIKPKFSA
ncbi:IS66 family insertion sequence element accessory protein TnpB [Butyrivibrio sp. TB]|uniref:IS66 family insertion sequence element accessory protein TnpB n=1 Tax=Butyrivibrio sp. TB TaxID=1520809 RepID=UPI0008BC402D|nr:IS66 family insertion sequence element accessory protein TnpB [Butyrivibrio sp. TB]SEQ64806.1 transposase [Butyrivibrio sp. TB]